MKRALLCVVTGNYLPMAVAMASSYSAHHPKDDIRILLVDVSHATASKIFIDTLPNLRIEGIDVIRTVAHEKMRSYYDASEMVGAMRSPFIKKILFQDGYDQIVMLDADIYCYAPLTPFFDALDHASIALTPHVNSPIPNDGYLPDDAELQVAGFVNNGCCAVRKDARAKEALDWLEKKAEHQCFLIKELNLYNEQTWVSFLPWYFPEAVYLVRDLGMNVAYWNLFERPLERTPQGVLVRNSALRFFHYSGYRTSNIYKLTAHSQRGEEYLTPVLRDLLQHYNHVLVSAESTYPSVEAEFTCASGATGNKLRAYRQAWGKASFINKRFRRAQWLWIYNRLSYLKGMLT